MIFLNRGHLPAVLHEFNYFVFDDILDNRAIGGSPNVDTRTLYIKVAALAAATISLGTDSLVLFDGPTSYGKS